jgi:putative hydrolase of the HAD superfamily
MTITEIQAVLFDFGRTLAEYDLPSWPSAFGRCVDGIYGFLVRPAEELAPPAASIPSPERARAARGALRPDQPMAHRVTMGLRRVVRAVSGRTLPAIAEACARPIMATGRIYEDSLPTLEALSARGYRMGLVSNTPWGTPHYLWERQVEKFALAPLLEVCLFSSGVGYRKPHPAIFREALRRLGVRAEHALFVGDTPAEDIAGARAVGMRTVLITRGAAPEGAEACGADAIIPSLRALPALLPERAQTLDRSGQPS